MNRKLLLFLVLLLGVFIGVVYATSFSYTYDTATPQGSDDPAEADDRMREIKLAVQERMAVNHYWPLTGTEVSDAEAGEHLNILFNDPIAATPTVAADHGDLRIMDVNGIAELVYTNESEAEVQLTSLGNNLPHNTYLTASDVAGTGSVNLIKADHNDVAVLPDNSQTATNAAPTSTTGIANKKYVDDLMIVPAKVTNVFGAWNDRDKDGSADTVSNNTSYEALTDGIVCAGGNQALVVTGYTDSANPPTNVRAWDDGSGGGSVTFPVKKGDYWKVTNANGFVFWIPIGE